MKHLIQYQCMEPGCHHEVQMEVSQNMPPPVVQCNKHRELPPMKVIVNLPINDDKGGRDEN